MKRTKYSIPEVLSVELNNIRRRICIEEKALNKKSLDKLAIFRDELDAVHEKIITHLFQNYSFFYIPENIERSIDYYNKKMKALIENAKSTNNHPSTEDHPKPSAPEICRH